MKCLLIISCCLACTFSYAQNDGNNKDTIATFTLGEVVVRTEKNKEINTSVSAAGLQNFANLIYRL